MESILTICDLLNYYAVAGGELLILPILYTLWGGIVALTACGTTLYLAIPPAAVITLKFLASIALLIFVRGGTPRYRYDYLTKLGWLKFLNLLLATLVVTILLYLLW